MDGVDKGKNSQAQIAAEVLEALTPHINEQVGADAQALPPITASLVGVLRDVAATEMDYYEYLRMKHA